MRRGSSVATIMLAVLAGMLFVPAASAQAPPVPGVPEVPPEVLDAVDQANDTAGPLLVDAAKQLRPGVNAVGFALRPACVQATTIALAFGLAGVPLDPRIVTSPYSAFCAGALQSGPADPVLAQVDAAAGPALVDAVRPVLLQANAVIEPQRPNLALVCTSLALAGPTALPPPAGRISPTYELCWR